MKNLGTIGKFLYALPLLGFGFGHLANANAMSGMVPSFIPGGVFWVYLTGVALILAVVAIVINKKAKLATMLLGIMLLIFALTIHLPGMLGGNEMSMPSLLKDLSLAGAAFMLSATSKD